MNNVGNSLQLTSIDHYKSIEHHVVANRKKDHISILNFVDPRPGNIIGTLTKMKENGQDAFYKEVVYSDYVKQSFKKPRTVDFVQL